MKIRPGKRSWKIAGVLALAVAIYVAFQLRPDDSAQKSVEATRQVLRREGFKTDLSEFDFSTSPELRAREAALTADGLFVQRPSPFDPPDLMTALGRDTAIVVWKQARLQTAAGEAPWSDLQAMLAGKESQLDDACAAALAGPIRLDLQASNGSAMLLRPLAPLKNLAQSLGNRTVLELHDGNRDAAWTNLLASTRLVTAWEPAPVEICHLVRFACARLAYDSAWQALQAPDWPEERLTQLQREWEAADFLKGLPETMAFQRACAADTCQRDRREPLVLGLPFADFVKEIFSSPRDTWFRLYTYWNQLRYRSYGSYADEKALLLFYRDRELELRRAIPAPTWSAMCQLPGVTNQVLFMSPYRSRLQAILNQRVLGVAFARQGASLLGHAAETETRRRLIITAIALERYHQRHGSYPDKLDTLAPEWLKNPPMDFMDGQPLRYRLTNDGHFVLYSVGLDGADDGGQMWQRHRNRQTGSVYPSTVAPSATDLVWPRPGSATQVEQAAQGWASQEEDELATAQWNWADERQAAVEKILARRPERHTAGPAFQGRSAAEILRNDRTLGTNAISLDELFTLQQVFTGAEPETATFEVPIAYDVLTNVGKLVLFIDVSGTENFPYESCQVQQLECERATNGNCRLSWHTIYESPGKHALQLGMALPETWEPTEDREILGPVTPFVVSNLCQFSAASATYDSDLGATLHARLLEPNGIYSIELLTPGKEPLKTFTGSTSNGVINIHWDLVADSGYRLTNETFDSVFHITLPDSGRMQTLKGP